MWNLLGEELLIFKGHTDWVRDIKIIENDFIISVSNDKTIKKISISDGEELLSVPCRYPISVDVSVNRQIVAAGDNFGKIKLVKYNDFTDIVYYKVHDRQIIGFKIYF